MEGRKLSKAKRKEQSLCQKFPDSERGEMKIKASFLGDLDDDGEEKKLGAFKTLQELSMSPTKGGKSPFSKTPRAKMGADPDSGGVEVEEQSSTPRGLRGSLDDKSPKAHSFGKFFLSKHRNKK